MELYRSSKRRTNTTPQFTAVVDSGDPATIKIMSASAAMSINYQDVRILIDLLREAESMSSDATHALEKLVRRGPEVVMPA